MPVENDHVSCRALGFHRRVAEHLGIPLASVFEGTGIDTAHVDSQRYIPWSSFVASMQQLERLVGGRAALVEHARLVNTPEAHPSVARVFSHVIDARLLVEVAARWAVPAMFPCVTPRLTWPSHRRARYEVEIPPHLVGCEPALAVTIVAMRSLPSWLGLPDAEGPARIEHDRFAWVELALPRPTSVRSRLKTRFRALTSGKRLVEELIAQNDELRAQKQASLAATEEADEQRRRAERASRYKSRFVAAVSHEMRTPLNALTIATQLLTDSQLSDAQRLHTEVVVRASRHMTRVLEDLIDLDGIEAGRLHFEQRPFSPRAVATEVTDMLGGEAESRALTLSYEVDDDVPALVVGDAARLRQVLLNLLGNALRYTESGGARLRMSRPSSGVLRAEVSDTGPGIDDDERDSVFEPFVQGRVASPRGAGLGLAITKSLVERMGGGVGVESALGEGSTFWCEIPLAAASAPLADRPASSPPATEAAAVQGAGVDVLLVEDDEVTRKVFVLLLQSLGCQVETAENGARSLTMCAQKHYDLVLMDCQMPVMGGLAATRAIRAEEGPNQATCIVGLTAGTRETQPKLWRAAGMSALMHKPLDVEELRVLLARLPTSAAQPVESPDERTSTDG